MLFGNRSLTLAAPYGATTVREWFPPQVRHYPVGDLVFPKIPGAPLRALRGFQRADIAPGATQHLRFTLDPRDLSCVNEAGDRLAASGAYRIFVGGGQPGTSAPGAEAQFSIQGELKLPE